MDIKNGTRQPANYAVRYYGSNATDGHMFRHRYRTANFPLLPSAANMKIMIYVKDLH